MDSPSFFLTCIGEWASASHAHCRCILLQCHKFYIDLLLGYTSVSRYVNPLFAKLFYRNFQLCLADEISTFMWAKNFQV